MIIDYEKQAKDFCDNFGVNVDINFIKTDKYFQEDKVKRDIYSVTISRGEKTYNFNFGDSIYNTDLRKQSIIKRKQPKKPTEYDILSCLITYDVGDFDDFIAEFGYSFETEREYIKVKQIYFNVVDEYKNVMRLFSDCIDELSEIQ